MHDLLALNRRRARDSGAFALKPLPARRSKRKRDFWLMVMVVNLFCVGFTAAVSHFSPMVMLYGFGCGCFLTAALGWIMWIVMDDY